MAHFCKINKDNFVEDIIVIDNEQLLDEDGEEQEALGLSFIKDVLKFDGDWKQCSYNNNIRGNYPADGYTYDEENDEFIPPQPYPSWTYNFETHNWESPVDYPENPPQDQEDQGEKFDTGREEYAYIWNEEDQSWDWTLIWASEQNDSGIDLSD
tara:strand:- start:2336 stop:2797 length:462 start_codon:yes stop_codon:yes gene_type:complete